MLINVLINTQKVTHTHTVQIYSHNTSNECETPCYAAMLSCCLNTLVSDLSLVMNNIMFSAVVIQKKYDGQILAFPSLLVCLFNWAKDHTVMDQILSVTYFFIQL